MRPEGAKEATSPRLGAAAEPAARFRTAAGRNLAGDSLRTFRFGVHMFLVRVFVDVLDCGFCRWTFSAGGGPAFGGHFFHPRWRNLLAAVHAGNLIKMVRETKIA